MQLGTDETEPEPIMHWRCKKGNAARVRDDQFNRNVNKHSDCV